MPINCNALELVYFAGRVVYIGYAKDDVPLNTRLIVSKELDGTGSRNALLVFPSVIKMLEAFERPFADLITRIVPFIESGSAWPTGTKTRPKPPRCW